MQGASSGSCGCCPSNALMQHQLGCHNCGHSRRLLPACKRLVVGLPVPTCSDPSSAHDKLQPPCHTCGTHHQRCWKTEDGGLNSGLGHCNPNTAPAQFLAGYHSCANPQRQDQSLERLGGSSGLAETGPSIEASSPTTQAHMCGGLLRLGHLLPMLRGPPTELPGGCCQTMPFAGAFAAE